MSWWVKTLSWYFEPNKDVLGELNLIKNLDIGEKDIEYPVTLGVIKWVSKVLLDKEEASEDKQNYYIHKILRGSAVYIEKPKPKERNPELEKRLKEIQTQIDEIQYNNMVRNVINPTSTMKSSTLYNRYSGATTKSGSGSLFSVVPGTNNAISTGSLSSSLSDGGGVSLGQELKEVNKQVSVIFNILFSVFGVWFAVFYASYTIVDDFGIRVLLGMFAGIFIAVAETYLYTAVEKRNKQKPPVETQKTIKAKD
ncbi:hypothetical protein H4219_005871 [Mycoemilia scoparia]|uniref:Uncharacterized protein n=1 Tax=Mycoemilia scoparia TaxID=417184 RepID=A0A9W7ZKZ9_9FUNG|nr:hypothetical protein H4219_005871 [Mycoemilia scoparia]